ncbi:MAG: hypothetical protein ACTSRG_25310 [Candidatus Helarchaeota archaeon]
MGQKIGEDTWKFKSDDLELEELINKRLIPILEIDFNKDIEVEKILRSYFGEEELGRL